MKQLGPVWAVKPTVVIGVEELLLWCGLEMSLWIAGVSQS